MIRQSILAAVGAVAISLAAISVARAHGPAASDGARVTRPMRVKHPAPASWRWSNDRMETAREPVPPPVNLFETGRPPAQPAQW
ncbi:hypothetical protein [Bradyrhizobium sp. SZCCHNS3004]|uniref:hypothetical protein n=1 Tax=Bradyrhizobium sp. SZCCHNS3004 TaxID=3057312 RepID=UPI002916FE7B|nr:hypothetical protein [Bradyrhizobium sp. SZCCHNS3004]